MGIQIYGRIIIEASFPTKPLLLQLSDELDFTRPGCLIRVRELEQYTGE